MASPAVLGVNSVFNYNGVDISGDGNQIRLSMTQGNIDTTTFGASGWMQFIPTISQAEITFAGFFDKAAGMEDALFFAELGATSTSTAKAWFIELPNASSNSIKYSGNCWALRYEMDAKPLTAITFTATLKPTSTVVRAVLP